ncbi:hypothetical protein HOLleu_02067 [Holothuria leucospilota]|uniref:ZU5 domain-containing protein n=1 Tax=Holothuria leucospilota TaxID=206669 RepID=A0A9Q1CQ58_HOLLE|nr:hypothetical protein HOLleu_02067 [Holothuria leucospilota]
MSSSVVSTKGGVLSIDETGVELHIPPNAFEAGIKEIEIDLRIIPYSSFGSSLSFEDHSTVMVEVKPNKLTLKRPASLFLPHCLKLKSTEHCEVRIFQSHHDAGEIPSWEDITQSVTYSLSESCCVIHLKKFCWIKYTVHGNEVLGKNIMLYVIGEQSDYDSEYVRVDVGYYPNLPGLNRVSNTSLKH